MKIFISSVIRGLEAEREAAKAAIEALGHQPIMAEHFVAGPSSPQVTCLAGVRDAQAVVLIVGDRYGQVQPSGKSATHEEFDEAKRSRPLFVFVRTGDELEQRQADFIAEVQSWASGSFTGRFQTTAELGAAVTRAVHRWEVSNSAGSVDAEELKKRVLSALPKEQRGQIGHAGIGLSVVGAPRQSVLRPKQLEEPEFQRELQQRLLFGNPTLFSSGEATKTSIEGHSLIFRQDRRSFSLSEDGTLAYELSLPPSEGTLSAIIEEDVESLLRDAIHFSSLILDRIDDVERLSAVAVAATVQHASYSSWRTRDEHRRSPNSMRMSRMFDDSPAAVTLSPANRSRSSLRQDGQEIAQDLLVLLRREFKD